MKTLFNIIDITKKNLTKYNYDSVFAIVGGEGIGKSNLMLHFMEYYDPNVTMNQIGLNTNDFINILSNAKKYQAITFDEAGDGLYSRDAMSQFNKLLNKTYMVIRGNNNLTFLVLPNFFDLDTYFRKNRIKGVFEVYARGKCKFFNKQQVDVINYKCENYKRIYGVKPSIYDTFPKYKGILKQDYDRIKQEKIQEVLDSLKNGDNFAITKKKHAEFLLLHRPNLTIPEIIYITGASETFIYKIKKQLGV